jgi:hypothetical protein
VERAAPVCTTGWFVEPFSDLSAAFVFSGSPIRVTVLDRLTWYVLESCDGREESEIASRVATLGHDRVSAELARRLVADRLSVLRERGLVEAAAG